MSNGEWEDTDEPDIGARCLMICREVIWNAHDPEAPYTLRGVIQTLRPRAGYPTFLNEPIHLYVEFYGGGVEQDVWVDLVRFEFDDDDEIRDEFDETSFGPFTLTLSANRFVHGRWYVLRKVPFGQAGVYEFRLRLGGIYEPLISIRIRLEE